MAMFLISQGKNSFIYEISMVSIIPKIVSGKQDDSKLDHPCPMKQFGIYRNNLRLYSRLFKISKGLKLHLDSRGLQQRPESPV